MFVESRVLVFCGFAVLRRIGMFTLVFHLEVIAEVKVLCVFSWRTFFINLLGYISMSELLWWRYVYLGFDAISGGSM